MAQIFHPSFNTLSKVSIFGAVFFLGAAVWGWDQLLRSSYTTQVNVAREQPVPFSHKHHVAGLGIDCRFCHGTVEESYLRRRWVLLAGDLLRSDPVGLRHPDPRAWLGWIDDWGG